MENESQFQLFRQDDDFQPHFGLNESLQKVQGNQSPQFINCEVPSTPTLRALNPLDQFKNLPQNQKEGYYHMAMKDKKFFGVRGLFGLIEEGAPNDQEFFGNLDPRLYKNQSLSGLNKLFEEQQASYQNILAHNIKELTQRVSQIQKKAFGSISLNRTIGQTFYDHLQNFSFLQNESIFINELQGSIKNFISNAKKIKGPGIQLIISIYDYCLKLFRDLVNQIWKHSQKFTLNFFKKNKRTIDQTQKNSEEYSNDGKSSNSSLMIEKEKRKQWTNKEIQILNFMIQQNAIFSNTKLKQLSEEFNRTTSSISSKIQKLIKEKKQEEGQTRYGEITLFNKLTETLSNYPQGLNKDQVIQRLSQTFQMGIDQVWKKSVTQLLSSRKQIIKKKGVFKLLPSYQISNNSPVTFKDRVAQCLSKCDNFQGDLKTITQKYLDLFGLMENYHIHDETKIKNLEASISKTICRYQIFDKSKSRTLYFFNGNNLSIQQDMSIESYIS